MMMTKHTSLMMMMKTITKTRATYNEESSDSEPHNGDAESQSESGPNGNNEVLDDESLDKGMLVETASEDDSAFNTDSVANDI